MKSKTAAAIPSSKKDESIHRGYQFKIVSNLAVVLLWPSNPMYSHTILLHPARDLREDLRARRESLRTLERLREGWRPGREILSAARRAEHWTINALAESAVYQFVGRRDGPSELSSFVIGTLLAIDPRGGSQQGAPEEGWALLAGNTWVALGQASPDLPALDPDAIRQGGEDWLRAQ